MLLCLVGRMNVTFQAPEFGELELQHTELSLGGSWSPTSCVPRHRVAVIIPFRDRQLHLRTLLTILHPMLQRQMLQYTVFVIEQVRSAVVLVRDGNGSAGPSRATEGPGKTLSRSPITLPRFCMS